MLERAYPGLISRGYTLVDGTTLFYREVARHVTEGSTVLDLGAGRGATLMHLPPEVRRLALFNPLTVHRIGVDVDPAVNKNPYLAESYVLNPSESHYRLPLADESADLVLADWVVEHLESPEAVFREAYRVLKPGGAFVFRTSNRRHYVAVGALLLETRMMRSLSRWVLRVLQGQRESHDVFPKFYRCNTLGAIRRVARASGEWSAKVTAIEAEPSYMMGNLPCALLGITYERLTRHFPFPRSTYCVELVKSKHSDV